MLWTARLLAIGTAVFWLCYRIASAVEWKLPLRGLVSHAAVPGLIYLAAALMACKRETSGGWALIIAAVVVPTFMFGFRLPAAAVLTLVFPALLAGALFEVHASSLPLRQRTR